MVTTWDNSNKGGTITLTNNNLIAQIGGTSTGSILSTTSKPTGVSGGKYMFEITIYNSNATDYCIGLADSSEVLTGSFGNDSHAVCLFPDPTQEFLVYFNSTNLTNTQGAADQSAAVGSTITFCVDTIHNLMWFSSPEVRAHQVNGANSIWNNTSTGSIAGTIGDPSANAAGLPFSGIGSPIFICFNCDTPAGSNPGAILNTGATPFAFTQNTAGFLPWDSSQAFTPGPRLIWLD